jgi:hypothetical protein
MTVPKKKLDNIVLVAQQAADSVLDGNISDVAALVYSLSIRQSAALVAYICNYLSMIEPNSSGLQSFLLYLDNRAQ